MSGVPGLGPTDDGRVERFLDELDDPTLRTSSAGRSQVIDARIAEAGLTLADKAAALAKLAATGSPAAVQYRRHGEEAFTLFTAAPTVPEAARQIRQILDGGI
jgi:hypothetical protein